jgi:polyhydroxyalkanoate synthesis regulator phasin
MRKESRMPLFDDLSNGVKKAFLAGVGAVAVGAEKSQELVDDLIKKGELTVEQGKALNEELTRRVKETTAEASEEVLRARLRVMSPEERAEWLARATRIAEELEAEEAAAAAEAEAAAEAAEAAAPAAEPQPHGSARDGQKPVSGKAFRPDCAAPLLRYGAGY